LSVDPRAPIDKRLWRSGFQAFCFGRLAGLRCKSLRRSELRFVDLCEKAIAIDKMAPICRQAFRQCPAIEGEAALGDRQNGVSFCSILSIEAGLGPLIVHFRKRAKTQRGKERQEDGECGA
jgi:hypothetical protein